MSTTEKLSASPAKKTVATVIPCLRYQDAPAAIDWLCRAFGFQKQAVYPGSGNTIAHAQLTFGTGMIMVSSILDSEFGRYMASPADIAGRETQCPYVIVEDADAHYAQAVAAGAEILIDIRSESYGGRGYSCRDPQGHVWSFGTYDPWQ